MPSLPLLKKILLLDQLGNLGTPQKPWPSGVKVHSIPPRQLGGADNISDSKHGILNFLETYYSMACLLVSW
jgi:hypothetical protein